MTEPTERAEAVVVSTSRLSKGGRVVYDHATLAPRTFRRQPVLVRNAPPQQQLKAFSSTDVVFFAAQEVVPLQEVQYFLEWGNCVTVSEGESAFDYPTVGGLLGFLHAVASKYSGKSPLYRRPAGVPFPTQASMSGVVTLPYGEFTAWLGQFDPSTTTREALMKSLDEFVGRYV